MTQIGIEKVGVYAGSAVLDVNVLAQARGLVHQTLQRIAMEYAFSKGKIATQRFCSLNAKDAYKWNE